MARTRSGAGGDGSPQTLEDALREFAHVHSGTEKVVSVCAGARAGTATLEWDKGSGTLLINHVKLDPRGGEPKYAVTDAARAVLADAALRAATGLRSVVLPSVLSPMLMLKLAGRGWSVNTESGDARLVGKGTCNLCGNAYAGFGHNSAPFGAAGDRCCDECNLAHVVPAR